MNAVESGGELRHPSGETAYAPVAQRIERHLPKVGVAGSNPAGGTQAGHVLLSHGSRKGVPSPPVGRNALRIVAQSVARPAGGREIAGSSPANPTAFTLGDA